MVELYMSVLTNCRGGAALASHAHPCRTAPVTVFLPSGIELSLLSPFPLPHETASLQLRPAAAAGARRKRTAHAPLPCCG